MTDNLKSSMQNASIPSYSTGTSFRRPVWFYCNEQSFLVSQMVSVFWNVRCLNDQTFKTQVSLANGAIINVFGQNRAVFASKCLNLKTDFEGDDFNNKLILPYD